LSVPKSLKAGWFKNRASHWHRKWENSVQRLLTRPNNML